MKHILFITILYTIISCCSHEESFSDCTNAIQDGSEVGIDCGGTCPSCETCTDGIKNQNEIEIDCGGSCLPCAIKYPELGAHGPNLLFEGDTLIVPGKNSSLHAIVPEGSSLKVELALESGMPWSNSIGVTSGWLISSFSEGKQTYEVLNPGEADQHVTKPPFGGNVFTIIFFENGTIETRRKVIVFP